MLLILRLFFKRCFVPDHEIEGNPTWEKLSLSRNWGFLKVEKGTSNLKMRRDSQQCSSTGFADLCIHGELACLWQARGSSSDKAKAGLSGQDSVKWGLVVVWQ